MQPPETLTEPIETEPNGHDSEGLGDGEGLGEGEGDGEGEAGGDAMFRVVRKPFPIRFRDMEPPEEFSMAVAGKAIMSSVSKISPQAAHIL